MEHKVFLRNVVGEHIETLGVKNGQVVVVNADLAGTCRNTSFLKRFPDRSFNVGIAEQNMVSFAAGLAHEGFKPYVFSMAPFLSMRACEQIRTDVAYGNKDVKMIAVYAGVSGGISGATHWSIEDCGIMTSIPNIVVFELSDSKMAKKVLDYSLTNKKPTYIRVGVEPVCDVYEKDFVIKEGGSCELIEGSDGYFLCSGVAVHYAVQAAKTLKEKHKKNIGVIDMYCIKPLDKNAVIKASKTKNIVVAQDHNVYGGLGSMTSKTIAEEGIVCNFKIVGVSDEFASMAHADYLYKKYNLDVEGLTNTMIEMFDKSSE